MRHIDDSREQDLGSTAVAAGSLYTCPELADLLEAQIQAGGDERLAVPATKRVTFTPVPTSS